MACADQSAAGCETVGVKTKAQQDRGCSLRLRPIRSSDAAHAQFDEDAFVHPQAVA
jgi:hypothetical protein